MSVSLALSSDKIVITVKSKGRTDIPNKEKNGRASRRTVNLKFQTHCEIDNSE